MEFKNDLVNSMIIQIQFTYSIFLNAEIALQPKITSHTYNNAISAKKFFQANVFIFVLCKIFAKHWVLAVWICLI